VLCCGGYLNAPCLFVGVCLYTSWYARLRLFVCGGGGVDSPHTHKHKETQPHVPRRVQAHTNKEVRDLKTTATTKDLLIFSI
jgi:hypothetical protein